MKKLIVTLTAIIMVALIALGVIYGDELFTKKMTLIDETTVETIEEVETTTEEVIETTTEVETTVAIDEGQDDVKHMIHINQDLATGKLSIEW